MVNFEAKAEAEDYFVAYFSDVDVPLATLPSKLKAEDKVEEDNVEEDPEATHYSPPPTTPHFTNPPHSPSPP